MMRRPGVRVLSVSRKDRGAILPVGRAKGDVYWYADGRFTTSRTTRHASDWVRAFDDSDSLSGSPGRRGTVAAGESVPRTRFDVRRKQRHGFRFPARAPTPTAQSLRENYPWMDSLTLDFALDGVRTLKLGASAPSPRRDARPTLDLALDDRRHWSRLWPRFARDP